MKKFLHRSIAILQHNKKGRVFLFLHLIKFSLKRVFIRIFHLRVTTERFLGTTFSFQTYDQFFVGFFDEFVLRQHFFVSKCDNPLIVDAGANIGMSSFFLKRLYPHARIIALEPDPKNFEDLQKNLASFPDIQLFPVALGNTKGTAQFFRDAVHFTGGTIIAPGGNVESFSVDTCRLVDIAPQDIDYLKLDIEGAEERVMRDIESSFRFGIANLFIEYHYQLGATDNRLSSIFSFLEKGGYAYTVGSPILSHEKISASFSCIILATQNIS